MIDIANCIDSWDSWNNIEKKSKIIRKGMMALIAYKTGPFACCAVAYSVAYSE